MQISLIISFNVNLIIYVIFDQDLSQDLSARGQICYGNAKILIF